MHELIITHVVPRGETDDEPAHTVVYRFEFEDGDEQAIEASIAWLRSQAIEGGRMQEQPWSE